MIKRKGREYFVEKEERKIAELIAVEKALSTKHFSLLSTVEKSLSFDSLFLKLTTFKDYFSSLSESCWSILLKPPRVWFELGHINVR